MKKVQNQAKAEALRSTQLTLIVRVTVIPSFCLISYLAGNWNEVTHLRYFMS
jgi:hypothetical protein